MRVLSWNLLRSRGASVLNVARLVERHRPDLVLLQEATTSIDVLPRLLGGHFVREVLPRRDHGLATWSSSQFETEVVELPRAGRLDLPLPIFRSLPSRIALVSRLDTMQVATVHLDHGQRANRRQLRHLLDRQPRLDMVIGDFNALGGTSLPGFSDVGPRGLTHWAYGFVPVRLDRCLVRELRRTSATTLDFGSSDHRPILIELASDCGRSGI